MMEAAEERTLHKKDILELSDLMDTVIDILIYQDLHFDEEGKPSILEPFTHEYELRRLHTIEHEKENPFFVFGGKWQGKPYGDYIYGEDMDPEKIRDKYLLPYKKQIGNLMNAVAERYAEKLGRDITQDYLLDLFAVHWYKLLEKLSEEVTWRSEHGLPARLPGQYDNGGWYVWIGDRLEVGTLEYVASEYCGEGLCFCFDCKRTNPEVPDYQDHEHSFEDVLKAALENPEDFTLKV